MLEGSSRNVVVWPSVELPNRADHSLPHESPTHINNAHEAKDGQSNFKAKLSKEITSVIAATGATMS